MGPKNPGRPEYRYAELIRFLVKKVEAGPEGSVPALGNEHLVLRGTIVNRNGIHKNLHFY